jgi:hypothetical protein
VPPDGFDLRSSSNSNDSTACCGRIWSTIALTVVSLESWLKCDEFMHGRRAILRLKESPSQMQRYGAADGELTAIYSEVTSVMG